MDYLKLQYLNHFNNTNDYNVIAFLKLVCIAIGFLNHHVLLNHIYFNFIFFVIFLLLLELRNDIIKSGIN